MFGLFKPKADPAITAILNDVAKGKITIIDVRDISEVSQSGKVKGAKHIPLIQLANIADSRYPDHDKDLKANRAVAVYCASGARSHMATQVLKKLGFSNVSNIGGFGQVVASGAEVVPR